MAGLITNIGLIVTAAIGWVTSYVGMVTATGNEVLLLFTVIPLVGLGIGLLKRLINLQ